MAGIRGYELWEGVDRDTADSWTLLSACQVSVAACVPANAMLARRRDAADNIIIECRHICCCCVSCNEYNQRLQPWPSRPCYSWQTAPPLHWHSLVSCILQTFNHHRLQRRVRRRRKPAIAKRSRVCPLAQSIVNVKTIKNAVYRCEDGSAICAWILDSKFTR